MDAAVRALLERAREEAFLAKTLVRSIRNSTKTTAAALQDSEDRIDRLIADIDAIRQPPRQEAQGVKADRRETVSV